MKRTPTQRKNEMAQQTAARCTDTTLTSHQHALLRHVPFENRSTYYNPPAQSIQMKSPKTHTLNCNSQRKANKWNHQADKGGYLELKRSNWYQAVWKTCLATQHDWNAMVHNSALSKCVWDPAAVLLFRRFSTPIRSLHSCTSRGLVKKWYIDLRRRGCAASLEGTTASKTPPLYSRKFVPTIYLTKAKDSYPIYDAAPCAMIWLV